MGTEIPIDPPGQFCDRCWGYALNFGPGPTPLYMTIEITGIEKGPAWFSGLREPINGVYTLTQTDLYPCIWEKMDTETQIRVYFNVNGSYARAGWAGGQTQFDAVLYEQCQPDFINNRTYYFMNGTLSIISF